LTEDEEVTIMEEFDAENYLMNLGFTNPAWRIEHNDLAIQLSNYFGRYFISKCKRNRTTSRASRPKTTCCYTTGMSSRAATPSSVDVGTSGNGDGASLSSNTKKTSKP
jgi:hypothetical protein